MLCYDRRELVGRVESSTTQGQKGAGNGRRRGEMMVTAAFARRDRRVVNERIYEAIVSRCRIKRNLEILLLIDQGLRLLNVLLIHERVKEETK